MTHSIAAIVACLLLCSVMLAPRSSAYLWPFQRADDTSGAQVVLERHERETDPAGSQGEEISRNEDTVINTILRVVDHKFDTLSARITALERAVNGLQYYSVRQFRLLYTNTKSINSQIQDISTRVSGLEIEISRADLPGVRDKVTNIDQDVKTLFRQNNDMFEGMEQTLVVVNDNVNKGALETKSLLEKKLSAIVLREPSFNDSQPNAGVMKGPGNADVNYVGTVEDESETSKNESGLLDVIDSSPEQVEIDKFTVSKYFYKLENIMETYFNASALRDAERYTTTTTPVPTPPSSPAIPISAVLESAKEGTNNLTKLIGVLDGKLADSVKFQRHAEHMLERLITNGESLSEQAIALSDNVAELQDKVRDLEEQSSKSRVRVEELQSHSLLETKKLAEKYVKSGQLSEECKIPAALRSQIVAVISKNASHVFDQLTELVQLSTRSLPTTLLDIHEVINKLQSVTTEYNALMAAAKADDERKRALDENETRHQIEETLNITRASFSIMEAVSSNTGWLPLLLDTIDVIGITANQTLAVANTVFNKVQEPLRIYIQSKTSLSRSGYEAITPPPGGSGVAQVNIHDDQLEGVYKTVKHFDRLLPSITRILSKSGYILNLVNGKHTSEGRVEVYYNGHWGTVCSRGYSDQHALSMCRLLGYPGGHLAPPGQFGAGQGPVWTFSKNCLGKRQKTTAECVTNTDGRCSHEDDLAIICDHMVRLDIIMESVKRGPVEVYLRGTWGGVCLDGWNDLDATVTCRQLGYRYGQPINSGEVHPNRPVWLRNVKCNGRESRLDQCAHTGWERQTCYSNRLAGVQCVS